MKKKLFKKDLKIPMCTITTKWDRELLDHVARTPYNKYLGYPEYDCVEVENHLWKDILTFTHFSRGRSSVKAHFFSRDTGNKFEMFISDMEELLLLEYNMSSLEGTFCFRKQGKNFGVSMITDEEET